MRSLSSPHCRASEHGFTFQLELPPFGKWRAQIITPNPPLKSTWPSWDHCERQQREKRAASVPSSPRAPFMPHNDGRTDGCRMWRCGPNGRGRGRGRAFPFRSLPRGLVGSGHRARGAHMPPHSPPTDHKMTRDSRWIQLTKRTTQEDAGRIIEFPRRYLTKRKVNGLRARDSSHFPSCGVQVWAFRKCILFPTHMMTIPTMVWSGLWSLLPHTAKAFEKAGIYGTWRTAIEATSQIHVRLGSSKRELGTGKTRRMTNSAIMTILNNDLPHCMLRDVLPGTKNQL